MKIDPLEIRQIALELGMIKPKQQPTAMELLEALWARQHRARAKYRIKRGPRGHMARRKIDG